MVKSRPNMTSVTKRIRAFLFLVVVMLSFSRPVSAASVTAPVCSALSISPTTLSGDGLVQVSFNTTTGIKDDTSYRILYNGTPQGDSDVTQTDIFNKSSGTVSISFQVYSSDIAVGPKTIYLEDQGSHQQFCPTQLVNDGGSIVIGTPGAGLPPTSFDLCQQAGAERNSCDQCLTGKGIWSGVGCIPFSTGTGLVRSLITLGLGITGTIVVLMTLYAGFMFSTSQGDPKRVDEARGAMTSAIVGAFFIIFSVTILQFIGVTILRLPSFG